MHEKAIRPWRHGDFTDMLKKLKRNRKNSILTKKNSNIMSVKGLLVFIAKERDVELNEFH